MSNLDVLFEGQPPVIHLVGEVDLSNLKQVSQAVKTVRADGSPLRVDMSRLRFIDSSGLAVLLGEAQTLNGQGPLVLQNPAPMVSKLLKLMGVDGLSQLRIESSE